LDVTLNQYDTFELQSRTQDLTGTRVYSNYPIAVFSGNKLSLVQGNNTNPDHLVSQLAPVGSWGYQFAVLSYPPLDSDNLRYPGDYLRIVSSQANTITYTTSEGVDVHRLVQPGDYVDVYLNPYSAASVRSMKPIQVRHETKSCHCVNLDLLYTHYCHF